MVSLPNTAISGSNLIKIKEPGRPEIEIPCKSGQKLSEAIWLSGHLAPNPLCNGLGLCGRCRVRFIKDAPPATAADSKKFTGLELANGWRLACNHYCASNHEITLELPPGTQQIEKQASRIVPADSEAEVYAGIDLGTTSLQWRTFTREKPGGSQFGGNCLNPQSGAGADIVSRLAYAMNSEGMRQLSFLAREAIAAILRNILAKGHRCKRICIAANSAQTEILLANNIIGLACAPYHLDYHGGEIIDLHLPGFESPMPTVIPPLPGPFVGGDISAGLLALIDKNTARPFILIDLGTNAEFALLQEDNSLYLASAPLGPALEGIGPECGQIAEPGVITAYSLAPSGLMPQFGLGNGTSKGISATGYLSLLAILFRTGIMAENGGLSASGVCSPLVAKIIGAIQAERLNLDDGLYLTQGDIELLLKVKAAFVTVLSGLLAIAKTSVSQIAGVYLAGALGEYGNLDDLVTLGFLPSGLATKTHICGNTALAGACLLAEWPEKCEPLSRLCSNAQILQLADAPDYMEKFIAAMHWGPYSR